MRVLVFLLLLLPLQEKPEWKRLEEAMRPPPLNSYDLTIWPVRPIPELSSPESLTLLQNFGVRPRDLGLKSPIERAHFQRILWAFFDAQVRSWKNIDTRRFGNAHRGDPPPQPNQEKPQVALEAVARLLRSIALTEEEIRVLPDPYARTVESKTYASAFDPAQPEQPFLPADLMSPDGAWVSLGNSADLPLAIRHARWFASRSSFHIYLRVPAGRAAALELVRSIEDYKGQAFDEKGPVAEPPVPVDTQVAILERPFLITPEGKLIPSPLVETVELRVLHKPDTRSNLSRLDDLPAFRFRLRPDLLSEGDPAPLRARIREKKEDLEPFTQLIENGRLGGYPTVESSTLHCSICHTHKHARNLGLFEIRSRENGKLQELAPEIERRRFLKLKEQDVTWTELQELWK